MRKKMGSFLVLFVTGGAEPIMMPPIYFTEPVEPQQRFLVVFFFVLVLDCLFRATLLYVCARLGGGKHASRRGDCWSGREAGIHTLARFYLTASRKQ